eukprot:6175945-Pleurochrysis_carterae.AAC.2
MHTFARLLDRRVERRSEGGAEDERSFERLFKHRRERHVGVEHVVNRWVTHLRLKRDRRIKRLARRRARERREQAERGHARRVVFLALVVILDAVALLALAAKSVIFTPIPLVHVVVRVGEAVHTKMRIIVPSTGAVSPVVIPELIPAVSFANIIPDVFID